MVVLDDVHKPVGATTFLGWFDLLGPRSLIIITSRDKQLLVQCRVKDIYEVQGLDEHEASPLFSRHVTYQNLVELVDYANGNPLALSIFGRELEGIKPPAMESAVGKLKRHLSIEIFDTFKKSYDALSDSEKEIFLVIVCFLRGDNVEYVIQLLAGCGFFPHVGIDVLVDKSLVFISDKRVKMHDLICNVGLKIIRDQIEETEMGYRFLDASNIQSLQEENEEPKAAPKQGNEDIKAITLDASNLAFTGHVAFKHMYNLRYMKIHISDLMENHNFCPPEHPQSSLPPELRLLHWENYPLQSFPQDFEGQHLVELNMPFSKLKKLWEGNKNLEMLKRVILSHSEQLENVDELQFSRNIEKIVLHGCSRLQSFPDMGQSQHLRVVNLSACIEIKSFPKVPPSIRKLHLKGTNIRELPFTNHSSASEGFSELVKLDMEACKRLQELPMGMSDMKSLTTLKLSGCLVLEKIHDLPKSLKELDLSNTAVREFPSSLLDNNVSELVILSLENCKGLQQLPRKMSNLKSLVTLKLSGCSKLDGVYDFPQNLKEIYLAGTAIRELPSSIVHLAELAILDLNHCKRLQDLPEGMENLNPLDFLNLSDCPQLKVSDSSLPQAKKISQERIGNEAEQTCNQRREAEQQTCNQRREITHRVLTSRRLTFIVKYIKRLY